MVVTGVNEAVVATRTKKLSAAATKKKLEKKKLNKLDVEMQLEGNQQLGRHLKKAAKLRRKKQRKAGTFCLECSQ